MNTLEDIGRLAVLAAQATAAVTASRCLDPIYEAESGDPEAKERPVACRYHETNPLLWCEACQLREGRVAERTRAKNTLGKAIRSFLKRRERMGITS